MEKTALQSFLEDSGLKVLGTYLAVCNGGKCLTVEACQLSEFLSKIVNHNGNLDTSVAEAFLNVKTWFTGTGTVIYFPNVPYVSDESNERRTATGRVYRGT